MTTDPLFTEAFVQALQRGAMPGSFDAFDGLLQLLRPEHRVQHPHIGGRLAEPSKSLSDHHDGSSYVNYRLRR